MTRVLSGILLAAWILASAEGGADENCCRPSRPEASVRNKIASPLGCRLELLDEAKAGQVQTVRLRVQNRFHPGTLHIRLRMPEPLRPADGLKQPPPLSLALGEEKQMLFPVVVPGEGQHRLEAVVSLATSEGGRISSSAFLLIGRPGPEAEEAAVLEATRSNGQRLRIHRAPLPRSGRKENR